MINMSSHQLGNLKRALYNLPWEFKAQGVVGLLGVYQRRYNKVRWWLRSPKRLCVYVPRFARKSDSCNSQSNTTRQYGVKRMFKPYRKYEMLMIHSAARKLCINHISVIVLNTKNILSLTGNLSQALLCVRLGVLHLKYFLSLNDYYTSALGLL